MFAIFRENFRKMRYIQGHCTLQFILRFAFVSCREVVVIFGPVAILTVRPCTFHSHVICPSVYPSIRLSVTLVDHDRIGWKCWKLIARTISPTSSLFVAQRPSTYSQGNMGRFWGRLEVEWGKVVCCNGMKEKDVFLTKAY